MTTTASIRRALRAAQNAVLVAGDAFSAVIADGDFPILAPPIDDAMTHLETAAEILADLLGPQEPAP